MKSAKTRELGSRRRGEELSTGRRPTTAPGIQMIRKSPRRAKTPLPAKTTHSNHTRPNTVQGLYDEGDIRTVSPRALSKTDRKTRKLRSKKPPKSKDLLDKEKTRTGGRVAWQDTHVLSKEGGDFHNGMLRPYTERATATGTTDASLQNSEVCANSDHRIVDEPKDPWAVRSTLLPRRRTGFQASALVPGSISTMVTIEDSEGEQSSGEGEKDQASGNLTGIFSSDTSSDYDTELEEDFPATKREFDPSGRSTYLKLCKDQDLVPVSFLSGRFETKQIVMRHHGLGSQGTLPIARALVKNTFTETLDLSGNYIEAAGGLALAQMLTDNCYITELDLSENFIRSGGGVCFAKMLLKNQSLKKLVLRSNHLTDRDARVFADALKENRTLIHLDLSHNEIGEMGGIYLGAGLGMNYGLKHFNISWNCVRFKGAVGMAQALKNNECLTHFDISWNGLSLLGCVALGRFLKKNEALEELDISNNRIGLLATQKLAAGIAAHPALKVLKIGRNPIGDEGVETLLGVVKSNSTIKFLSLEDITVSPKIFDEIKELEQERGIRIVTGGIGGYKRPKEMPPGMRILLSFVQENRLRLVDWFRQFDKDQSGGISRDEFKLGLKETGLVMTQRQLDRLIKFIDINDDGEIEYSELMRGREMTLQEQRQERKIEERQKRLDEQRMRLPKLEGYDYDLM